MPLIRQEEIYAVGDTPWAQAIEAVATAAIAKNDIVIIDGVSGIIPKVSPADADNNVVGQLYVAAGKAAAAGDKLYILPYRVVSGVNTAAGAAGDPVYLDAATAGAITLTKPIGVDDTPVVVGVVLSADASGVVRLDPGKGVRGLSKVGTINIASGGTSNTAALGANFGDGRAVATMAATATNNVTVRSAAIASNGTLTVTLSGDPGAGGVDVTYVAYSAGI